MQKQIVCDRQDLHSAGAGSRGLHITSQSVTLHSTYQRNPL